MPPSDHRLPVVSVVLPTRNRATTLGRAIDSVLAQDFSDLELIVVDDGSTDETPTLLATMKDDRVRCLSNTRGRGAPAARNTGIAAARGRLVAFQDSDDVWTSGHLSLLVAALETKPHQVGVAYGRARFEGADALVVPGQRDFVLAGDLRRVLPRYNIVSLPASIVRSEALTAVGGFDETLQRYQDWDLFLALSRHWQFAFVDEILLVAGTDGLRITTSAPVDAAIESILDRHADLFRSTPDALVAYRLRLARLALGTRRLRLLGHQLIRVLRYPRTTARQVIGAALGRRSPIDRVGDGG